MGTMTSALVPPSRPEKGAKPGPYLLTTRLTWSRLPRAPLTMDRIEMPVDRAAALASSNETSSGTLPITLGQEFTTAVSSSFPYFLEL